jgi:predicted ATPase/class 3 adenylate cyclase
MPLESEAEQRGKGPVTLPTGTVTFLFSDIEGSTQRWEAHHDEMKTAVARHDTLMRNVIEQHRGYVFKTVGDAFCVAFLTAADAIAAALAAQRALIIEDFSAVDGLSVRMGLHTGYADERDADYFGPTVNRVARLMSIGHGGQVLISGATRDQIPSDLPMEISLIDLGLRRLKDLTQPEQVWQLNVEGLPAVFPPLNSLDARPNNLPFQSTSFRGRERDLEELEELLSRTRLLTLVGAGGIGKTRLSQQVAADLLDRFPDGVWFVELAQITDPTLVAEIAAAALGAITREDSPAIEAVLNHVRRKKTMLILDNCEHLIEPAAQLANAILQRCPDVRILATSRQALGVSGETVHRLASLAVPQPAGRLHVDEAMQYGAIALFVDRAQAADTRFALTNDNASDVAEICRRLDGIALAIELAAARMKVLSLPHLAQRLNERLRLLTGGARTALPRQKTLRALIDWSYDLLTVQEQTLFRRVAIFAGGFSLAAATAVCARDEMNDIDALDLLSSLVDKSLVVAEIGGHTERFRLLESTREYSLERLAQSGELGALSRLHAEYYRTVASDLDDNPKILPLEKASMLEPDTDNCRAALDWALEQGNNSTLGGSLAGAMDHLWSNAGLHAEGLRWVRAALKATGAEAPDNVAARLSLTLAHLSDGQQGHDAAERAMLLYERLGDSRHKESAMYYLGFSLYQLGRYDEAENAYRGALALARGAGDRYRAATNLNGLASVLWSRGDVEGPRRCYAEALAAHTESGNEAGRAAVLGNLAEVEFSQGNVEQAIAYASESLTLDLRGKNSVNKAVSYNNLAAYRTALGKLDEARSGAREAVRLGREAQNSTQVAIAVQNLALIGALAGDLHRSAQLLGYVDKVYRDAGSEREPTEAWVYAKLITSLRGLRQDEAIELRTEGSTWSEDQAADEALKA